MTITAKDVLAFAERNYIAKGGHPFRVKGREWVRDELAEPLFAWKYWPKDPKRLCKNCKGRIGEMTEWSAEEIRRLNRHRAKGCGGLALYPVMLVVLNLQRGAGKTTNTFALIATLLTLFERYTVAFVASAGKQARQLVEENLKGPIRANPKWLKKWRFIGDKVLVPRKRGASSYLELTDTSHGSITGRRRDVLFIDEGRDVEGRTLAALLPSIKAKSQFMCPQGHARDQYVPSKVIKCPACSEVMVPSIPKVVVSSTSGVIEGGEHDWFMELVDFLESNPSPYAHLYRDDNAANPAIARSETEMLESIFGEVPSIATYMDIELHNIPRRKGEDFVTVSEIKAIIDDGLANVVGSERQCFGFLDTSRVGDLTSLVIIGTDDDKSPHNAPWQFVRTDHIAVWDPKQTAKGHIERDLIQAYLVRILRLFPNLIELLVDVRGGLAWALDMVTEIRAGRVQQIKPYGRKIIGFNYGQQVERDNAWAQLEHRIIARTWRTFPHKILEAELKAVRRHKRTDGTIEIRDRNRKIRHADVAEGVAQTMHRIYKHMIRPTMSLADLNTGSVADALKKLIGPPPLTGGVKVEDF